MHFRKGYEQKVDGIQHKLYAHKYHDRITAYKHAGDADAE